MPAPPMGNDWLEPKWLRKFVVCEFSCSILNASIALAYCYYLLLLPLAFPTHIQEPYLLWVGVVVWTVFYMDGIRFWPIFLLVANTYPGAQHAGYVPRI